MPSSNPNAPFGACVQSYDISGCALTLTTLGSPICLDLCDITVRPCYNGWEIWDKENKVSYDFRDDPNPSGLTSALLKEGIAACKSNEVTIAGDVMIDLEATNGVLTEILAKLCLIQEADPATEQILECLEAIKDRKDVRWFGECVTDELSEYCGMPVVYCLSADGSIQNTQVATPSGLEDIDMSLGRGKVFDAGADFTPDLEKFVICHGVDDGPLDLAAIEAFILASGETWDNNDPMGGLAVDSAVIRKIETRVLECGEKKADGTPVQFQGSNEQCAVSIVKDGAPYGEINGGGGESCEAPYEAGGVEFDQVYTPNVDADGNTAYIEACVTIERRYARSKGDGFGAVLPLRTAGEKSKSEREG